jgi:hypothetical protein
MTIRTVERLSDALAGELAWRKKELSSIKALVDDQGSKRSRRDALVRAGVALLYAHWEGFVREAGRKYLEFVALQRLKYKDLATNFIALSARHLLRSAQDTERVKLHLAVTNFFINELGKSSRVPFNEGVRTQSNLSSAVLREIVDTLGLDYSVYATKENLLDESLLRSRNSIAHGEYLPVTVDRYNELHEQVIDLMDVLRTQIDNAASTKLYRC